MPSTVFAQLEPRFVVGGSVGVGVAFVFYVATIAKAMDTWRRSTHDTAIHLLYNSIENSKRRGPIGHNHGIVKPGAEIIAGVLLVTGAAWLQNCVLIGVVFV